MFDWLTHPISFGILGGVTADQVIVPLVGMLL